MLNLLEHYIEEGKKEDLIELLGRFPELADQKTSRKLSPILFACYLKKPEIAEILVDYIVEVGLFEAAALGRFDWVAHQVFKNPESINEYSEIGFTALSLAIYFNKEDITRYLLLKGADVNQPAKNASGLYPLHSALVAKNNTLVKMLLEAGADVNIQEVSGITPLHLAASQGNLEIIICLLEAGADVRIKTNGGKTPGDWAEDNGWTAIARILNDY